MNCDYLELILDENGTYTYYCNFHNQIVDINECVSCCEWEETNSGL